MHSHQVFFWIKTDLSRSAILEFEQGLESLTKIPFVQGSFIGKPAKTANRPVVDGTYSYGLTLIFTDLEHHNLYQAAPVHLEFVNRNAMKWERVLIYDLEEITLIPK